MSKLIFSIPNQHFCFLEKSEVKSDDVCFSFSKPISGTIFVCNKVVDGNDDAIVFFGVPDGDDKGRIAYWKYAQEFQSAWNSLLTIKEKAINEEGG